METKTMAKLYFIRNTLESKAELRRTEIHRCEDSIRIDADRKSKSGRFVDFGSVENSVKLAKLLTTELGIYNECIGYIDAVLNSEEEEDGE